MASWFVARLLALDSRETLSAICSPARRRSACPGSTGSGDGSIVAVREACVSHAPGRRAALWGDRDRGRSRGGDRQTTCRRCFVVDQNGTAGIGKKTTNSSKITLSLNL